MLKYKESILNVAEAKKRFSEIVNEVVYHHKQFTISRHGKPMVGIVPASELPKQSSVPRQGFLSLVGLWENVDDLDQIVKDIYKKRKKEVSRPVPSLKDN